MVLQLPAKIVERRAGAKLAFVRPVSLPSTPPPPLPMLFCYMDHVQNIGRQHRIRGGGKDIGELAAVLWVKAIQAMQEWVFGYIVSTTVQLIRFHQV